MKYKFVVVVADWSEDHPLQLYLMHLCGAAGTKVAASHPGHSGWRQGRPPGTGSSSSPRSSSGLMWLLLGDLAGERSTATRGLSLPGYGNFCRTPAIPVPHASEPPCTSAVRQHVSSSFISCPHGNISYEAIHPRNEGWNFPEPCL